MVAVAGIVAACIAVFGFLAVGGDDEPNDATPPTTASSTPSSTESTPSTTTTTTPPDPVSVDSIAVEPFEERVPDRYRIAYDVMENGLARTEMLAVDRPFESLTTSTRDGAIISGTATSRDRLWNYLVDRAGWLVIQPELHRAAFDLRPLAAMATMVSLGFAEQTGTDEYLGRPCRRFLTGQPITNTGATRASAAESNEVCIDDEGLVLHEKWQIGGSTVIERTVTAVDTDADNELAFDAGMFDPTPAITDAPEFEAILSTIAVPADEETLATLATDIVPPDGFELAGTVLRSGGPDTGGSAATEVVRFYSNGTDLIEVAEFSVASGADLDGGGALPVDIDGPETWFLADFRASAVRTRLSDTTFVEIRGTNPAQLIALLDTLTRR